MRDLAVPVYLDLLGRMASAESYSDLWRQRVLAVLCTPRGTRVMRPKFGSSLNTGLFENYTEAGDKIESIVGGAFADLLPDLSLIKVESGIGSDGEVLVDIWYRLPNGTTDTTQVQANGNQYGFGAT